MEKTFTMIMHETKIALATTCNESRLPACVLEPMVKELYEELHNIAQNQLQQDTMAYQQAQEAEPVEAEIVKE